MRKIGLVTVARSDFGIYLPLIQKFSKANDIDFNLIVTGMHFEPKFGNTVSEIEAEGCRINYSIPLSYESDSPRDIARIISVGVKNFSDFFHTNYFDLLILLGDRYEMLAVAVAALPFKIPIAHLHGGESTEGLIDEAIRHSITKMSHLHFASTEIYRERIIRMGESPDRVFTSGALSLDSLLHEKIMSKIELENSLGFRLDEKFLLATFHPVTLEFENTKRDTVAWLKALASFGLQTIITYPNSDTFGSIIIQEIEKFADQHSNFRLVPNLGKKRYFAVMAYASAMVGNSSSGIIEAASFKLPVINIGERQKGRIHGKNVLDVLPEEHSILKALKIVTSHEFRKSLEELKNPYDRGGAAQVVYNVLRTYPLDNKLIEKKFFDGN